MPKAPQPSPDSAAKDLPKPPPPIEMVKFDFRGETFEIPKDRDDWDTEAFIAIARGDRFVALQIVLGTDQWIKLRAKFGPSRRVAAAFSEAFSKAAAAECIN